MGGGVPRAPGVLNFDADARIPLPQRLLEQIGITLFVRIVDAEGRRSADGEDAERAGGFVLRDRLAADSLRVPVIVCHRRYVVEYVLRRNSPRVNVYWITLGEVQT